MCERCCLPFEFADEGYLIYHANGCPSSRTYDRELNFGICEHCDAPSAFSEEGFLIYHTDGCPPIANETDSDDSSHAINEPLEKPKRTTAISGFGKSASAWSPFGRRGILQSHFGRACGLHNESPTRQQGWRPVAWPLCGHRAHHRRDCSGLRGQTLEQQSYLGSLGHQRHRPSRRGRRATIVHMPELW